MEISGLTCVDIESTRDSVLPRHCSPSRPIEALVIVCAGKLELGKPREIFHTKVEGGL